MKILGFMLIIAGVAGNALAGGPTTPEIDASAACAAVTLLSGGLLILRSRRARR